MNVMKFADGLPGNIWKYTILSITNKRIFVAILGAFYLTISGVTPKTIGTILLISSIAGFILEIPSGYVSDKIGHKSALVLSRVFMLASSVVFLFSTNIVLLIIGGILMSASNAFQSGTGSAFMHETLDAMGKGGDYSKIMGKISSIGFAVPIIFSVLVPFFVSISYKIPFAISVALDLVGLIVAISLVSPKIKQEHIEEVSSTNFKSVIKEAWNYNYFSLAIFSGLIMAAFMALGNFRAPYQVSLGIPVIIFGVFMGAGRILASIILANSGKIKKHLHLLSFYRLQLFAVLVSFLMLWITNNIYIVIAVFILSNAFQWGLNKIDEGYQLESIKTSKFKATILSMGAQIEQAFTAFFGFALGYLIDKFTYQYGFLIQAIIIFVLIIPAYLIIAVKYKNKKYNIEK